MQFGAPRASGRLRSLISTMYAAMRIDGQRSVDRQTGQQQDSTLEVSQYNESGHLEPVDGQPRKEDLARLERYKYLDV